MVWLQAIFWLSLSALVHTYVVYPLIVIGLARFLGRSVQSPLLPPDADLPRVSVLIAAYNAGKHIEERVENLQQCHYPANLLSIVVAADGCTDDTTAKLRAIRDPRVRILDYADRRGKAATLVRAMPTIESDIVVFTDASSHFGVDAILHMVRHFSDPTVGIVSGRVCMLTDSGSHAEGFYWRLESNVRRAEASLGIVTGVSGAIYAMRRSVFVPPDGPTINDDMLFPILAKQRHGCRFVLDEEAVAEVVVPHGYAHEFRRRRRIGKGAIHSFALLRPAMSPAKGASAVALISHKVLRWMGPVLLFLLFVSNLGLVAIPLYAFLLVLQGMLVGAALVGYVVPLRYRWGKLCRIATSFYSMNVAFAFGFADWWTAADTLSWEPTPRPSRT